MPSDNAELLFVDDFTGGLNFRANDSRLRENEASELLNYEFAFDGSIKKRAGSSKYNAAAIGAAGEVHSLFRYYQADGTKKFLCIEGSTLYEGNDGAGTWASVGSVTGTGKAKFATWQDKVYFVNQNGLVRNYDGTTLGPVASSPTTCKYILFRGDRLYAAGDNSKPNRLYFTDTGDPTTWTTGTNYIDIRDDDGDVITGLAVIQDTLVIYKRNSIWLLYGNDAASFQLQMSSNLVGCDAPYSLVEFGNKHYFLDRIGVYVFDGTNAVNISENIYRDVLDNGNALADIPAGRLDDAVGTIYERQYYLGYSRIGDAENGEIFVYNIRLNAWSRSEGISVSSFANWNGGDDEGQLYSGDYSGFARKHDIGTDDDGVDIETKYSSKYFNFNNPLTFKKLEEVSLVTDLSVADLSMIINTNWGDNSQSISFPGSDTIPIFGTAIFGTDKFTTGGNFKRRKSAFWASPYSPTGRNFSVTLAETSSSALQIVGFGLIYSQEPISYGKTL